MTKLQQDRRETQRKRLIELHAAQQQAKVKQCLTAWGKATR
jgi:hypothetical protein